MIGERELEGGGEFKRIARGHEVRFVGVGHHLGDAVDVGADDARAEDHRLEQYARE